MEVLIVGIIIIFVLEYNQRISTGNFIRDNEQYFKALKEDNYDFLVKARYGDQIEPDALFTMRVRNSFIILVVMLFLFITKLTFINAVLAGVIAFLAFKLPYMQLNSYYKARLHKINLMLPYFLKNMEILAQHYTIPVGLSRSISTAPDIFKPGLRELVEKINAGDSSVDPYMEFAKQYPVADSVRMMRLLYRLGIGGQVEKHEQLIMFSRSVSALQNKAREMRYRARLKRMENRTLFMLATTGGGVMIILLISMMQTMKF